MTQCWNVESIETHTAYVNDISQCLPKNVSPREEICSRSCGSRYEVYKLSREVKPCQVLIVYVYVPIQNFKI